MATSIKDMSQAERDQLKKECLDKVAQNCKFIKSDERERALKLLNMLSKYQEEIDNSIPDFTMDI